jgi:hypothetical protein
VASFSPFLGTVIRKPFFLSEPMHCLERDLFNSWRRARRALHDRFTKSSVKGFYDTQIKEAVILASDLLSGPARWDQHSRRASASTTLSVLYGYPTLKSDQDHIVKAINNFAERLFTAAYMGAHLVQIFPWLRHVPSR